MTESGNKSPIYERGLSFFGKALRGALAPRTHRRRHYVDLNRLRPKIRGATAYRCRHAKPSDGLRPCLERPARQVEDLRKRPFGVRAGASSPSGGGT